MEVPVHVVSADPPDYEYPGAVDPHESSNIRLDGMCTGILPPEYSSSRTFHKMKVTRTDDGPSFRFGVDRGVTKHVIDLKTNDRGVARCLEVVEHYEIMPYPSSSDDDSEDGSSGGDLRALVEKTFGRRREHAD